MSQKGTTWSATKSFLGRRRSGQVDSIQDQRRSSVSGVFSRKKYSEGQIDKQYSRTTMPIDLDAQMAKIKEQLHGLRLQRTDMQRRVEDINSTLNDIRGEYASRVSLSGSTSDLSSIGSLVSISDESSSLSSGHSRCCMLEEDCESSGIEFDLDDDDDGETECASSASSSTTDTVELHFEEACEEVEQQLELLSVSQVAYL